MKFCAAFLLSLLFLLCCANGARAGTADTLQHMDQDRLVGYTFRVFNTEIQYTDSVTAFRTLDRVAEIARDRNSCALEMCAVFLKGKYCFIRNAGRKFKVVDCIPFFDTVLAKEHCSDMLYTEAMFFKGYALSRTAEYSKGFEYIIRAKEKAKAEGFEGFPNTFELYALLGNTFYSFSDYENSLTYLLEAIPYQSTVEMREAVDLYNTIALCYRQMGKYDTAGYYFKHALDLANTAHVSDWIGIVSGNIGELLYRQKQYREALPYLQRDVQISMATQQTASAAKASLSMVRVYLALEQQDSAAVILQNARPLVFQAGENKVLADYYQNLFKLYKDRDGKLAIRYVDSFHYFQDLAAREMDVVVADRIKSKLETEKYQSNIKLLESEKRWHQTERKSVVVILLLIVLVCWLIVRRIRQERRHARKELANACLLLDTYTASLKQKSRLLEEARLELDTRSIPLVAGDDNPEQNELVLQKLQQATILTEENWKDFKRLFSQIHTQFFSHLEKHFPNLTNAEIRLLALSKIGLSTNEKASALGISPDSVRKTKLRLYKKLGITEEEMLRRMM
ncbi:tetratricopeptide repeat protein [Taibaiella chishuiensis]|uniref:DNA-binding CsgD family transcriptional regulator n=1 Tax=Taibaiella chishuiensis TaxID=1434707 RepID=A0A2P8D813_9BACT|nr:tetratricopeptide repeat protein [Taibaiella chishuiensis]PSK93321.1 DNA-binding CsgD family transcriptional regulator [Taibaiella chishuiensis]